ncbi:MAG TPA: thiamine pyrophosphate-dependent enzyme, partial [Myxococcota bacterium]|nr:thiamine pyrophosphate-dependent enzyme [Myxococcota bacterium]
MKPGFFAGTMVLKAASIEAGMTVDMAQNMRATKKTPTNKEAHLGPKELLVGYRTMYTSRMLDEKMLILLRQGKSFFHIGAMGHEAVQVACGMAMKPKVDYLFPYYRDQALCLSLGQSAYECLLAFLARRDDPHGGGRQMPMHYGNKNLNIPSSSSSTGTQFVQAVGSALASLRLHKAAPNKEMAVTVCAAGEGTTSQGEFYEAISWAAREQAPIVFLIENNRWAISVEIHEQRPGGVIAENFRSFNGLVVDSVDGCLLEPSFAILRKAIDRARQGEGPTLIDADVVRLLPHSSSDDHKKYRLEQDLELDRKRDPIALLRKTLLNKKIISDSELAKMESDIKESVDQASDEALLAPMPPREHAMAHVWSSQKEPKPTAPKIDENGEKTVMVDAINRALREGLASNDKVLVFGQDVAYGKGGVFTATRGLTEEFGDRCFNAPLAEASIAGVAIGFALRGFKPVAEIQFGDYIWTAMMQIRNELVTMRYRSNNQFSAPVVLRVPIGGYIHGGLCHSQNIESTFAHFPGLKIALPSTAIDAYGLLKNALISEDPVLFLEHKALYRQSFARSILPVGTDYVLPFGVGAVRREGKDISVITYGILVQRAMDAALQLATQGISIE